LAGIEAAPGAAAASRPAGPAAGPKAWSWELSTDPVWEEAAEDLYYPAARWAAKGFRRVLDLGCGLGRNAILFAERGFEVAAVDLSPLAVAKTEEKAAARGLSLRTAVCDMAALPFPDGAFDCLFAYHVVSHTDSAGIGGILAEMGRVVRRGGELYATFCSKESPSFASGRHPRLDGNTILKTEGPEVEIPHYYSDEASLRKVLAAAGFRVEKLRHTYDLFEDGFGCHYFALVSKGA